MTFLKRDTTYVRRHACTYARTHWTRYGPGLAASRSSDPTINCYWGERERAPTLMMSIALVSVILVCPTTYVLLFAHARNHAGGCAAVVPVSQGEIGSLFRVRCQQPRPRVHRLGGGCVPRIKCSFLTSEHTKPCIPVALLHSNLCQ